MSIRKPTKTTIRSHDFTNHRFTFPVESVLKPEQGTGKLIISASPGYLLTTSANDEPTQEQTLEHVLQPNGNRVARGTITLLADDEAHEDSTITICNPSGETVVLTVDAAPESLPAVQEPTLEVSTHELLFAKTPPGETTFRVFTLAQHHADTPVTITTDAPELFQLASDSRPAYAPSITLTPSETGTHIHVRYAPSRATGTESLLTLATPYTTKYVNLTSPRAGWLPVVRNPQTMRPPEPAPARTSSKRWLWATQLLVVGLALAGYQFRCQLMPSLCQEASKPEPSASKPITTDPLPTPTLTEETIAGKQKPVLPGQSRSGREKAAQEPATTTTSLQPDNTVESPELQKPVVEQAAEQPTPPPVSTARTQPVRRVTARTAADSQRTEQPRRSPTPVPNPNAESELERELNKKPVE